MGFIERVRKLLEEAKRVQREIKAFIERQN